MIEFSELAEDKAPSHTFMSRTRHWSFWEVFELVLIPALCRDGGAFCPPDNFLGGWFQPQDWRLESIKRQGSNRQGSNSRNYRYSQKVSIVPETRKGTGYNPYKQRIEQNVIHVDPIADLP